MVKKQFLSVGMLTLLFISMQTLAASTYPKFANPDVRSSDNFVVILAGTFRMGTPETEVGKTSDENDEVLHDVTITRNFEIQSTVVTQAQYFFVMGYNPSNSKRRSHCSNDYVEINGTALCPNSPVESVSWNSAQNFIHKLNTTDSKYSYRLPTEAEWEYSARAGSQTAYWYGNDAERLSDYAWFLENSNYMTHAVGSKPANPWGLYDVHGNVWQWVSDWYGNFPTAHQTDPAGASSGRSRVVRGGSWSSHAQYLRSGYRDGFGPGNFEHDVGFRLVRIPK